MEPEGLIETATQRTQEALNQLASGLKYNYAVTAKRTSRSGAQTPGRFLRLTITAKRADGKTVTLLSALLKTYQPNELPPDQETLKRIEKILNTKDGTTSTPFFPTPPTTPPPAAIENAAPFMAEPGGGVPEGLAPAAPLGPPGPPIFDPNDVTYTGFSSRLGGLLTQNFTYKGHDFTLEIPRGEDLYETVKKFLINKGLAR